MGSQRYVATSPPISSQRGGTVDERGEVFPVAILFVGVLLTILIGLHVVLMSIGRTAVQAAADRGVTAAQAAQIGPSTCGTFGFGGRTITPAGERECAGALAAQSAVNASGAMVLPLQPPLVGVDDSAGVVWVAAYGAVLSPVFGPIEVSGYACGALDLVADDRPSRADLSSC